MDFISKMTKTKKEGVVIIIASLLAPPVVKFLLSPFMGGFNLFYSFLSFIKIVSWIGVLYGVYLLFKKDKIGKLQSGKNGNKIEQEPNQTIHIN